MKRVVLGWIGVLCHAAMHAAAPPVQPMQPTLAAMPAHTQVMAITPTDALAYAQQLRDTGDHQGMPFVVVDKAKATIWVYRADGSLAGTSSVLLGQAKGDAIKPGTGERTQSQRLRPDDRTTPAGRFLSEPGHNAAGEPVVWVDYSAAFAIHRLRPGMPWQRRAQRLASPDPRDKRISAGCVVVPVAFYLDVVQPLLGRHAGVVYVMREDGGRPSDLAQLDALAAP